MGKSPPGSSKSRGPTDVGTGEVEKGIETFKEARTYAEKIKAGPERDKVLIDLVNAQILAGPM